MPGVSKAQKAEAKYNVVLEFQDLGLHSAAASGNLGLVKYALDHGQPVNSALDGVLPLHAACSGGDELVVRLLIERGADVNAPRLPRRYSTDKHRHTVAPLVIVAASGSTPLHFASANGHTNVVLTLLLHGAHPDRPDKHGITPEILARQNGHTESADVLREWCHNKDKDLREREEHSTSTAEKESHPYCGSLDCRECATRKRIRMKRSIDNAIHILRHSSSHSSNLATPPYPSTTLPSYEPPSPRDKPFGEYSFYPTSDSAIDELPPRRPSLPHVLDVPRGTPTSHRSRRPSNLSTSSSHRPRSAGSDAEQSVQKVKGKLSLLGLFKKNNEITSTPDSLSSYNSSSSAVTSASTSPAPGYLSSLKMASLRGRSTDMLTSVPLEPSPVSNNSLYQRLIGDGSPSMGTSALPQPNDLYRAGSRDSLRGLSSTPRGETPSVAKGSLSVRPGILRAHGRSSSSGQSTSQADSASSRSVTGTQSPVRALRFDSSSSALPSRSWRGETLTNVPTQQYREPASKNSASVVHGSSSSTSLRPSSPPSTSFGLRFEGEPEPLTPPPSRPSAEHQSRGKIEEGDEDEDEEYGDPIQPQVGMGDPKTRLCDQAIHEDPEDVSKRSKVPEVQLGRVDHVFKCPFSINCPPPEEEETVHPQDHQSLSTLSLDSRMRGNSLSSTVTDTSGPPSSYIQTPSLQQSSLPGPTIVSPSFAAIELPEAIDVTPEKKHYHDNPETPISGRRLHTPLDIDIRTISSHAQAEALVQRAQQRIFDLDDEVDEEESKSFGINLSEGRTPLSARLAAYGESLAIERKFKEEEERKSSELARDATSMPEISSVDTSHGASRLDRKWSLQERGASRVAGRRTEEWKRPHTSGGTPISDPGDVFLTADPSRAHVTSTSNSDSVGRLPRAALARTPLTPPTSSSHLKVRSETLPADRPALPRSRTPEPDTTLSFGTSFGVPLTRYTTCPIEESYNELLPRKSTNQARQAARAQKLAKMGFSAGGESWRDSPSQSRNQKLRFGGIKTLVQNLTGRA